VPDDIFRWFALALLVTAIGLSGFHRRRARRGSETIARSRESAALIAGRLLVALPFLAGTLAYILNPAWMAWGSVDLPVWLRWFGVALGLAVVPGVQWVLTSLGKNVSETVLTKTDHQLVQHGPYRWVRHPLYTTGMTMLFALGLMAASWFLLTLAAIALVLIRMVVVPIEERELTRRFGAGYTNYMAHSGAMLPRLR
jgi:protein-S-isoprenylcysteine O-methyltransferase Ste14